VGGLTLVDTDLLKALVNHPKWVWQMGMLCFPYFKPTQRVRRIGADDYPWYPALDDPVTLGYLHHLYVINNGSVRRDGEIWVSSHGVEGKDLAQVLVESFLKL
jgi:hypothetical protein